MYLNYLPRNLYIKYEDANKLASSFNLVGRLVSHYHQPYDLY